MSTPPPKKPKGAPRKRQARPVDPETGDKGPTPAEERFALLVATGSSKAAAYRAAYPEHAHWSPQSQATAAWKLSETAYVANRVGELAALAAKANNFDAERVIGEVALIAFADARELTRNTRRCCRHCWGLGYGFQRTDEEMRADRATHETRRHARLMKDQADPGEFDQEGGTGFDPTADPNPSCTSCRGKGTMRVTIANTDDLSPEARAAFAGIEEGRDGVRLKLNDKVAALTLLARHKGALTPETEVHVTAGPNLAELDQFFNEAIANAKEQERAMKERARRLNEGMDDQSR